MNINYYSVRVTEDQKKLDELAMYPDPFVRAAVASNTHTTDYSLKILAYDPSVGVRASVAGNNGSPQETILMVWSEIDLKKDNLWPIFLCFANNKNSLEFILEKIYIERKNWAECLGLVNNESTPKWIIEELSEETDPKWREIRIIALERLAK